MIVKLCGAHPCPREARWTEAGALGTGQPCLPEDPPAGVGQHNPVVMTKTALQLFNINNATLSKWYNDRMKVTIGLVFVFILMS